MPTLLVLGAESYLVRENQLEVLRDGVGDLLTEATVPGGHQVYWDAFDETAAAIDAFLAS